MFNDFLGREITLGDSIVYPGRRGSSMWLNRALVVDRYIDSKERGVIVARRPDSVREVQITNPQRIVVVSA